ncbi:MAG: hypothetical protein ACOC2T_01680 [Planctomycetota bacterium]
MSEFVQSESGQKSEQTDDSGHDEVGHKAKAPDSVGREKNPDVSGCLVQMLGFIENISITVSSA